MAWRVTGGASSDGAMRREPVFRMAMTLETERVEPRLNTRLQVVSLAFMAHDAVLEALAVCVIVVTAQAIHLHVLAVRKVESQGIRT